MTTVVDVLADIFARAAAQAYLGEPVSMADHMLQTAAAAEHDGASPELLAAALLHDVGHLVHTMPQDAADHGIDTLHEMVGARWLSNAFAPAVTDPIGLHVAAKRYLCATSSDYMALLSPASVHSLMLQGGPMTEAEATGFEALPHWTDAVRVRQWDDCAKVAGRAVASFDHYRPLLEHLSG